MIWGWFTPDRIVTLATVIYAVVTIITLIYVISQSRAPRRQADIMHQQIQAPERSLALQEVALRQWVSMKTGALNSLARRAKESWSLASI
jgi:hypothetical protein